MAKISKKYVVGTCRQALGTVIRQANRVKTKPLVRHPIMYINSGRRTYSRPGQNQTALLSIGIVCVVLSLCLLYTSILIHSLPSQSENGFCQFFFDYGPTKSTGWSN